MIARRVGDVETRLPETGAAPELRGVAKRQLVHAPPTLPPAHSLVAVPIDLRERRRLIGEGLREWLEGERRLIDVARRETGGSPAVRDCVKVVGWITLPDGTKLPDIRPTPCK